MALLCHVAFCLHAVQSVYLYLAGLMLLGSDAFVMHVQFTLSRVTLQLSYCSGSLDY